MKLEDFGQIGGSRRSVVVLGAGASRGSAQATVWPSGPLPPLDADYFQQLSRLKPSDSVRRLLAFVRSEYGHELGLSMERFFSETVQARDFRDGMGEAVAAHDAALQDFYRATAEILNRSTADGCRHHIFLARRLELEDTIISFNYDCLIDRALVKEGRSRWDPRKGYGLVVTEGAEAWTPEGWTPEGYAHSRSIRLLKLHGSMNWEIGGGHVQLLAPRHEVETLEGRIIPPTLSKTLFLDPFGGIWKSARRALHEAQLVIVAGYSFPSTDHGSRLLFSPGDSPSPLDLLVLINPDVDGRRVAARLLRQRIVDNTRIIELDRFEHLDLLFQQFSSPRPDGT